MGNTFGDFATAATGGNGFVTFFVWAFVLGIITIGFLLLVGVGIWAWKWYQATTPAGIAASVVKGLGNLSSSAFALATSAAHDAIAGLQGATTEVKAQLAKAAAEKAISGTSATVDPQADPLALKNAMVAAAQSLPPDVAMKAIESATTVKEIEAVSRVYAMLAGKGATNGA